MQNFTLEDKQALEAIARTGVQVKYVAYDPNTAINPETEALAAGMQEYYREDGANLTEVIFSYGELPFNDFIMLESGEALVLENGERLAF